MSIQTHDYIRYDTITLSKALHYLNGKKIYRTERKHTHVKWLHLVKQVGREVPKEIEIHLIADNFCTHKHEIGKAWLEKRTRFQRHFVPTSSSWVNLVERFFADLTTDCMRTGSIRSVAQLLEAITLKNGPGRGGGSSPLASPDRVY